MIRVCGEVPEDGPIPSLFSRGPDLLDPREDASSTEIRGKKSDKRKFKFFNGRMDNGGMRAATANVNVHAIVYFIDFLNLKKIT